jgi:predicted acyl esterase
VFRGRFRKSLSRPEPIAPGKVLDYDIDLHAASHVFRKGHRIAVQVQSSWFPLIDRNPQTFMPSIFEARPVDFQAQTHSIFHDPRHASAISVSVDTAVR